MTVQACEKWLWSQALNVARLWSSLQTRDEYAALYLYFKRGELTVAESRPEGFELATGKRISPASTGEQVKQWVYDVARKLPCLPEGA